MVEVSEKNLQDLVYDLERLSEGLYQIFEKDMEEEPVSARMADTLVRLILTQSWIVRSLLDRVHKLEEKVKIVNERKEG